MSFNAADFIRDHTVIGTPSLVPEITMHLATEVTPLWQMTEERLQEQGLPPPFWAFAWPGGQGMARYILENPSVVKGKRVLDFAAGGGIASIAAKKAGAKTVLAAEIDPLALAVLPMNAALSHVTLSTVSDVDFKCRYPDVDMIIAGDVCYQQDMAATMMRWLVLNREQGVEVYLADPGRAYVPREGLIECARYIVPTSRDLEDQDTRHVTVWALG